MVRLLTRHQDQQSHVTHRLCTEAHKSIHSNTEVHVEHTSYNNCIHECRETGFRHKRDDIITMATSLAQQVVGELELYNTIFLCIDTTLTFRCLSKYKTWKMIALYVQTKSAIKAEIAT